MWQADVPLAAAAATREGTRLREVDERRYVEYVANALPTLRRTAYLLCGDEHRADDVVQTAITRLYVHWRKASAAESLDAYVRSILVRTFLNEQRRRWARVRLVGAPAETPATASFQDPDVETRSVVHAALTEVPPRQRAVLVLRFLCDLSVEQVAEELGCSTGTVKSQTARGAAALRAALARQGEEPSDGR